MNYKLLIQYDGTDFHGWQVQKNKRTVQGELQKVLSLLEFMPKDKLQMLNSQNHLHLKNSRKP
jgi:tRNA pseudouridine38-40 synthase